METCIAPQPQMLFQSFKSYYVVWKQTSLCLGSDCGVCLNRTMQYGNKKSHRQTSLGQNKFKSYYVVWKHGKIVYAQRIAKRFKSYYVVWKLSRYFLYHLTTVLFKSYYVVWKLFRIYFAFFFLRQFKSYYVVWKPQTDSCKLKAILGLNRTMQYGN